MKKKELVAVQVDWNCAAVEDEGEKKTTKVNQRCWPIDHVDVIFGQSNSVSFTPFFLSKFFSVHDNSVVIIS